jgi:hypothetical protein
MPRPRRYFQVLSQCGNHLSRENVMRQSASLRGYQNSVALPGITFNTGPADFHPIKQMRLVQFDGTVWQPIGDRDRECVRWQHAAVGRGTRGNLEYTNRSEPPPSGRLPITKK